MNQSSAKKIAILLANGFDEKTFLMMQRMVLDMGGNLHIISTNNGLVNGWAGQNWGHNYTVDAPLNTALGVDYDGLIMVGGERSNEKLMTTAHTKRFIGSMMMANKPVIAISDALDIMAHAGQLDGKSTIDGSAEEFVIDANLMTAKNADNISAPVMEMFGMISDTIMQQAA